MIVTVLLSVTKAYVSVLSATGSLEMPGASRCDDMSISYWVARSTLATSLLSVNTTDVSPTSTSISPVETSRTCTNSGPSRALISLAVRSDSPGLAAAANTPGPTLSAPIAPTAPIEPFDRKDLRLTGSIVPPLRGQIAATCSVIRSHDAPRMNHSCDD